MTWLAVPAVILLLILLLLNTNVKVNVSSDGDTTLRVGFGAVMVKLGQKKRRKISLGSFTQKKYLKKLEALRKKRASRTASAEADGDNKPKEKKPLGDTLELVRDILTAAEKYTGRINADIKRLSVTVGGRDAAAAAVTYGAAHSAVSCILELLDSKTKLKIRDAEKLSVRIDYLSEKTLVISIDLTVKIKLIDALRALIELLSVKLKHDGKVQRADTKR